MTDQLEALKSTFAGRYTLERELGSGGMATVYLAQDVKHGRSVALKVLRPDLAASLGSERFLREIGIAARLRHPHILPLYDSGETDTSLYYVMPFVEGESLRELLNREKQLAIEDAIAISGEVADALSYAHSQGIIHRDIKPENVMLEGGHVSVMDFGIAYAVTGSGEQRLTLTGTAVGTAAYMSPEQASGADDVDGRSDVYALGCVMYEMLIGEPPFTGPNLQAIIARHMSAPVPGLRTVRDTVPEWLERVVMKSLAKTPADRFRSAEELKNALTTLAVSPTESRPELPVAQRSIAVLPFVNMSADTENEFLSDGITEELIHALTKVQGLQVVGRTSAFAFKGKNEDLRAIGERLNVSTVLEGSVRRAGARLRTTTQLVNVADGYQLWSERYEHELKDIFDVQDEVARSIVEALEIKWLGGTAEEPGTPQVSSEAWELYLRGKFYWNQRTAASLRESVDLLQQAIELEPEFALAHASLADCHTTLGIYGLDAPGEVMPLGKQAASRALEIDGQLAEAFTTLGCISSVYDWDWEASERHFKRALKLRPTYTTGHHWYAINLLAPLGRFDEARAELLKARVSDPLSPIINVSTGLLSLLQGRYDEAIRDYERVREMDPRFGMVHYFLGQAYAQQGAYEKAIAAFEQAVELAGDTSEILAALGHTYAVAGEAPKAREILDRLHDRAQEQYVSPALVAQLLAGLGEVDSALDSLEQALDLHATELVWLHQRPSLAPLRESPRFARLAAQIGFPD